MLFYEWVITERVRTIVRRGEGVTSADLGYFSRMIGPGIKVHGMADDGEKNKKVATVADFVRKLNRQIQKKRKQ